MRVVWRGRPRLRTVLICCQQRGRGRPRTTVPTLYWLGGAVDVAAGCAGVVDFFAGVLELVVAGFVVFFFAAGFFGGSVSSTIIFFGGGGGAAALSVFTCARSRVSSSSFAPVSFCIRSPRDRRALSRAVISLLRP